ncbi:N-acetylmuramoyl-L-alanine amidase family protein [Desulfofundulus salinus]|uniref:Cell wall hydrolase n=1 Tax=Desulfofundulus salinus TaxID=2419843 RepID=A0A494WWZ1_9FIRM|nr:N-acetylmuramoyl-L-alanine amidase [Desulfofundulus salinum]RKO66812.1 cell wall hydrolase [Desulfofundulus salinum]
MLHPAPKSFTHIMVMAVIFCLFYRVAVPLEAAPSSNILAGRVIVIDPGHGGDDPGTVGCHGIVEKDVAMEISRRVADVFRRTGARVVLTRDGDRETAGPGESGGERIEAHDLARRVELANKCGAHLFLSIHLNHFSEPDEYGAQVFYQTGSQESRKLAEAIQAELNKNLVDSGRQALAGDFYVCRNSRMPAVIVEVGFLSHERESRQLTDPAYQERAARAILQGVVNYFQGDRGEVKQHG